jgi:phosphopantothenoylcysteine decarboxylase/phosphopantothenate--cysteine ligase
MDQHRILVAVSGGIAAYKLPELIRTLVRAGHAVRCAVTREATAFVTPLVLQTLTGRAVRTDLFDAAEEGAIDHIALADWPELVILAPATANRIAKLAHGIADDLVSTVMLATRAPVLMAPAMNVNMWNHAATRENVATLERRGITRVGPDAGELACGWEGEGRMAEPSEIAARAELLLGTRDLAGVRLLVTAGGTRESVDAVRYLGNRSSGKMGYAVARQAARRGAEVVLVSAPSAEPTPAGVRRVDVGSALEMREAVLEALPGVDVVVKAAAVADFRPATTSDRKIKKEDLAEGAGLTLELVRNPDILEEVCRIKGERIVVGFAAESHDVIESATRKLRRKGCDLLVANDVSGSGSGFDVDVNTVSFVWPDRPAEELPPLSKDEVASHLLDRVSKLRGDRS